MVPEASRLLKSSIENKDQIEIEHLPQDGVIVRRSCPELKRRNGIRIVAIVCAVLSLIPVAAAILYHNGLVAGFVPIIAVVFSFSLGQSIFRQFSLNTRSDVLRVDYTGLTIETTTWRQHTTRHFARAQISDIVLDCGGGVDPHHSSFKTRLIIQSPICRNTSCLYNTSGDQLARAADALRAGLLFPKRSWP